MAHSGPPPPCHLAGPTVAWSDGPVDRARTGTVGSGSRSVPPPDPDVLAAVPVVGDEGGALDVDGEEVGALRRAPGDLRLDRVGGGPEQGRVLDRQRPAGELEL